MTFLPGFGFKSFPSLTADTHLVIIFHVRHRTFYMITQTIPGPTPPSLLLVYVSGKRNKCLDLLLSKMWPLLPSNHKPNAKMDANKAHIDLSPPPSRLKVRMIRSTNAGQHISKKETGQQMQEKVWKEGNPYSLLGGHQLIHCGNQFGGSRKS